MKTFTVIKTGYSAGAYGCSNEFFTAIYTKAGKLQSFSFKGMYGSDSRIKRAFKEKGYTEVYVPSFYGQLKGEDRKHVEKFSLYDDNAVKFVVNGFKKEK